MEENWVYLFNYLILNRICNKYILKRNYGIVFAPIVNMEIQCSMEATNSAQVLEGIYDASEEELIPLVEKETMELYLDHYDEPSYLFRGVIIGLSFCLPFWAIMFWIII